MRRALPAFLLLSACLLSAQETVRVLSYNIHHGEGVDARLDLPRIANAIKSVDPDVVALQEVDVQTQRSGGVDQARELARLTGMHVVFGRTIFHQGGLYGNAILSKRPATGFVNHRLPVSDKREPRAVLDAGFEQPDFRLFATHLDITKADRLSALPAIEKAVASHPEATPILLVGDLNDTPNSAVLDGLRQHWSAATLGAPLLTIPVDKPARQIDWILFRPASRWKVKEVRVLDEAVASDHRAIFAVMELGK